jgi:F-type H+-transporting ATPase subunit b
MPQFDATFFASQVFWLVTCVVILYFLMTRKVLPRISEVLEERSNRIASDLEKATILKQEIDALITTYEASVARARSQAADVISAVSQEIATISAERQTEFAADLASKIALAEGQITAAKEAAKSQIRDIAIAITSTTVTRLIGSSLDLDEDIVAQAVDSALRETA